MSTVVLPDWAADERDREAQADRELAKGIALHAQLREYDPRLSLVWVNENATVLTAARWHVHVQVDEAPDLFIPITGPNGEYREPDSGVLEELRLRDLQRRGDIVTQIRERRARVQAEREKAEALAREQRADNVAADYKAALRVPDDRGLTKRVWGRG